MQQCLFGLNAEGLEKLHALSVELLDLLKDILPGQLNVFSNDDDMHQPAWLGYLFRRAHPILRWLPSKLSTWIRENFGQELCIPPKRGQRTSA